LRTSSNSIVAKLSFAITTFCSTEHAGQSLAMTDDIPDRMRKWSGALHCGAQLRTPSCLRVGGCARHGGPWQKRALSFVPSGANEILPPIRIRLYPHAASLADFPHARAQRSLSLGDRLAGAPDREMTPGRHRMSPRRHSKTNGRLPATDRGSLRPISRTVPAVYPPVS
jgi:hypothetical protein